MRQFILSAYFQLAYASIFTCVVPAPLQAADLFGQYRYSQAPAARPQWPVAAPAPAHGYYPTALAPGRGVAPAPVAAAYRAPAPPTAPALAVMPTIVVSPAAEAPTAPQRPSQHTFATFRRPVEDVSAELPAPEVVSPAQPLAESPAVAYAGEHCDDCHQCGSECGHSDCEFEATDSCHTHTRCGWHFPVLSKLFGHHHDHDACDAVGCEHDVCCANHSWDPCDRLHGFRPFQWLGECRLFGWLFPHRHDDECCLDAAHDLGYAHNDWTNEALVDATPITSTGYGSSIPATAIDSTATAGGDAGAAAEFNLPAGAQVLSVQDGMSPNAGETANDRSTASQVAPAAEEVQARPVTGQPADARPILNRTVPVETGSSANEAPSAAAPSASQALPTWELPRLPSQLEATDAAEEGTQT